MLTASAIKRAAAARRAYRANKVTTTKSMDHNYWRRLQLIDPGYTGPTHSCFYRRTAGGLSRVCGDVY
jgi:hypothetical protein